MIKHVLKMLPVIPAVAFLSTLFSTGTAHAVPAFARANKVECTTCHTIAPELNEYGEAFLKNSYVYVGKASKTVKKNVVAPTPVAAPGTPAEEAPKVMGEGDPAKLSKLKAGAMGAGGAVQSPATTAPAAAGAESADSSPSEGMILAGIPEQLPISFTGSINYFTGDKRNIVGGNEVDFAARSFKLHAAGNFRDTIGFFATYVAYAEGAGGNNNTSSTPSNAGSNINEFFFQWRNLLGTPINLKAGRMQPKLGLWKTNNKISVTNPYTPYNYAVGESTFSIDQPQDALELNSILGKRFFVAGGIVNHKGQNAKDGYGHVSYKFGGADYLANEPDVDLTKEENIFDFLTVTVGSYGYAGSNGHISNIPNTPNVQNNYYRIGLDTEVLYKNYRLRMLGGYGVDDNATPQNTAMTLVRSKAFSVEGEVTFLVNLIAAGRFEFLQEEPKYVTADFQNLYTRKYIATLGYTPLENFKVSTEFKYEIGQTNINRIGTLGATFSF